MTADAEQPGTLRCAVSPAQPGLWFATVYGADPTAYNQPLVLDVPELLDHHTLEQALRQVHSEHEALRTTFTMDDDGTLFRVVHDELSPLVDVHSYEGPADAAEAWATDMVDEVANGVFDLETGPLVRVRHLRFTTAHRSRLVFNVHHSVFDGMSWRPFLRRLEAIYALLEDGDDIDAVGDGATASTAYERWSMRWQDERQAVLGYWRERLAGAPEPPRIGLPSTSCESPRDDVPMLHSHHYAASVELSDELTERIREFCRAQRVTTSMFYSAVFATVLHRQTGHEDVLFGMPVTMREPEDSDTIGHLTNTITLRSRTGAESTAADILSGVRSSVLEALRYRHAPLDAVVGALRQDTDHDSRAEPFSAMITVMPAASRELELPRWGVDTWEYRPGGSKYDLALVVNEGAQRDTLITEHTSAATGADDLTRRLADRLVAVAEQILTSPQTPLADLDRPEPTRDTELAGLSRRNDAPEIGTELTADLFVATAETSGSSIALITENEELTYAELSTRVDAAARGLASRGVRDGHRVALLLPPGADLIVAVLGTLRAGGAYVTLDPTQPAERTRSTLEDSDPDLVVASGPAAVPDDRDVLQLSDVETTDEDVELAGRKKPSDTAYVVFTSGSTGRPKGVQITEATLSNLVHAQNELSGGRRLRTLQYMNPAFDVFAEEVFGTLCTSAALVIPPASARTDFAELADLLERHRVERIFLPYVALRELAAVLAHGGPALPDLREVYTTGERLVITDDLRAMFRQRPDARLANVYGPSEAHLCTGEWLSADVDVWPTFPPIGRVVRGVDARVLDGDRPVPVGVQGELCIAGPVVSPGYIGRPEQNARSFVNDPLVDRQRMYRTGDVVVLTPDGRIHCLGRADDQVKIRGFRVEPAEVEAIIERTLDVDKAAVVAVPAGSDRTLHGFVTASRDLPTDWRSRLTATTPTYLVPQRLTRVDDIPVTASGKTDRAALAARIGADPTDGDPHGDLPAPDRMNDRQAEIARLWAGLLGAAPTSIDDDFFALGGYSLLAARLHRAVQQRFGDEITLSQLMSTPTVRGMAERLQGGGIDALDLAGDATLPAGFEVAPRRTGSGDLVFLTGATGFLGVHLLDELVRAGRHVGCLVRAADESEGRERLRSACLDYALDPGLADSVRILPGNLCDDIGLRPQDVCEVFHAAAHINFVAPYASVRGTNVDGVLKLLEFCAADRVPMRLMSTVGVFPPDSTPPVVNELTVPGDPASLGIGYSQSKWVADHLASAARDAGLPVTIHRIGRIGGHSRSGACRPDDFLWLHLKAMTEVGSFPRDLADKPPSDLLPADYVARAVRLLSEKDGDGSCSTWHLHNARPLPWDEAVHAVRSQGYDLTAVDPDDWLTAVERVATDDGANTNAELASLVPMMREGVMRLGNQRFDNTRTQEALSALGHPIPSADSAWLHRMFAYFAARGAVTPPTPTPQNGKERRHV